MPDAKFDGKTVQSVPASVKAAMAKGYPKAPAQSLAGSRKPVSQVKV